MKEIYACKLYQASSRKEKIIAALNDPINKPLVKQLQSYLDPEYQKLGTPKPTERVSEMKNTDDTSGHSSTNNHSTTSSHSSASHGPMGSPPSKSSLADRFAALDDTDSIDIPDDPATNTTGDSVDVVNDTIEAPEDIESIDESTNIPTDSEDRTLDVASSLPDIKQALLDNPDTSEISRICCKEDEVWIYYQDKVNLNNIMGTVIETLDNSEYSYLEFNRLARSANAIVFQVNSKSIVGGVSNEEDL